MKLIRTRDGKIGTEVDREVMWHKTPKGAYKRLMTGMLPVNLDKDYVAIQVNRAMHELSITEANVAEFGVFGSCMYSYMDLGYEE
jgi:hypothetical protein